MTGETSIVQNQLPAVRGLERRWEGAFNGEMAVVIIPEGISHGSFGLKVSFFGYTCDFQDKSDLQLGASNFVGLVESLA